MRIAHTILAVAALVTSACSTVHHRVAVDPQVTFAVHQEHARLVVDRAPGGGSGEITPTSGFRGRGSPGFTLHVDGQPDAWLWVTAPATVDARQTADAAAERVGQVTPTWEDGAVRFALRGTDGQTLQSDTFQRVGTGGSSVLCRDVHSVLDLRGTFRAELHDPSGGTPGWLRIQLGPYNDAPRIYDAVLPPTVSPALAAAAAVALGSEIDWIEYHTLDVYRGSQSGPLQQSVPLNGH